MNRVNRVFCDKKDCIFSNTTQCSTDSVRAWIALFRITSLSSARVDNERNARLRNSNSILIFF
jgi:hypothetical protein